MAENRRIDDNVSLYVNGVKKIETSLEHFPNNIEELGIPVYNNNDDSNNSRMTPERFGRDRPVKVRHGRFS